MDNWFVNLITNPFLLTGISSWILAQVVKLIIHSAVNKKIVWERLFGDGGMPSGHSATVMSIAVLAAIRCGTGSFEFAIAAILAVIVGHDAMGVRWETGKQAVVLTELVKLFEKMSEEKLPQERLKTFVGHTPLQVIVGAALGFGNAFLMNWLLP